MVLIKCQDVQIKMTSIEVSIGAGIVKGRKGLRRHSESPVVVVCDDISNNYTG